MTLPSIPTKEASLADFRRKVALFACPQTRPRREMRQTRHYSPVPKRGEATGSGPPS
jgi:hypothetical protein